MVIMIALTRLFTRLALAALLALPAAASALADDARPTLRVLAWPGYADPDVVAAFEKKRRVRVDLVLIASDEALWERIGANDGGDFDVFAVNTAELQRYIAAGLVQPINPPAIPNIRHQLPRFQAREQIAGLVHQGHVFGIPYTYAEMGLIYDRSQFAAPPDSIAAMWDPALRGRVLAYNGGGHNFSLAALLMGKPSPFQLRDEDWPEAVTRLVALRRNVLGFYTDPDEATRIFIRHKAALLFANYGSQQVQALRAAGADIGYIIPKEGALAWMDCWAITRGARDTRLAEAWIDHMLTTEASDVLVSRQGLANTISEPADSQLPHLLWLEPMEDPGRRDTLWSRIMSGDHPKRILAP